VANAGESSGMAREGVQDAERTALAPDALGPGSEAASREAFWLAVRADICERLGHERSGLWFDEAELLGLRGDKLVIGVPNILVQQYLTERYALLVAEAAGEQLGRAVHVVFDVAPHLFRQARARRAVEARDADRTAVPAERSMYAAQGTGLALARGRTESGLPPAEWRMDRLIATPSNRLPLAAARELAGQENPRFRFLYVCGDYGLGKSALLKGVCAMAADGPRNWRVVYVSAEDWANQYFSAIPRKSTREFRRRFRDCDVLVIDDIQFVEGKPGVQNELVHTIKHVLDAQGRVALGGRVHPETLRDLDPALTALLRQAFPAVLVQPDEAERLSIVRELAARHDVCADSDVLRHVARAHGQCFGSMKSAVSVLALISSVSGGTRVELPGAVSALGALRPATCGPLGLAAVCSVVADAFGFTQQELTGKSRQRSLCRARHIAICLSRRLTGASLSEVGRFYSGMGHSSVKHAADKIERLLAEDDALSAVVRRIERGLGVE
jgi:chromosomal replication initiator protein